jgi:DNA-3-methyladenine glycosylase I
MISDSKIRCGWCLKFDQYIQYHDEEWGVPVHDDRKHFEFLILEGAQAGLSWATILKRRDGYRKAFAEFDPTKVAKFTPAKIEKLLKDPRHHSKSPESKCCCEQRKPISGSAERIRNV